MSSDRSPPSSALTLFADAIRAELAELDGELLLLMRRRERLLRRIGGLDPADGAGQFYAPGPESQVA